MRRLRVVLGNMPRLMNDVIAAAIKGNTATELVGRVDDRATALDVARTVRADVVILAEPSASEPSIEGSLLAQAPAAVVAIGRDGQHAALYALRPHRTAIDSASVDDIVAAIRQTAIDEPARSADAPRKGA